VLCTTLRNPLNYAPNVMDYRASGYSVRSPAGLMLERCNVSFRNATKQAASARNAIEEAYDRGISPDEVAFRIAPTLKNTYRCA
jgi:hypothetical protein